VLDPYEEERTGLKTGQTQELKTGVWGTGLDLCEENPRAQAEAYATGQWWQNSQARPTVPRLRSSISGER